MCDFGAVLTLWPNLALCVKNNRCSNRGSCYQLAALTQMLEFNHMGSRALKQVGVKVSLVKNKKFQEESAWQIEQFAKIKVLGMLYIIGKMTK